MMMAQSNLHNRISMIRDFRCSMMDVPLRCVIGSGSHTKSRLNLLAIHSRPFQFPLYTLPCQIPFPSLPQFPPSFRITPFPLYQFR